jgi:hypothetical protein
MAGLSPLSTTFTTSLSSTPTGLMASDDDASLYSPHTPTDSNHPRSNTFQQLHHHCKWYLSSIMTLVYPSLVYPTLSPSLLPLTNPPYVF